MIKFKVGWTASLRRRNLSIIMILCLFLLPQWVKAEKALHPIPGPTALVQVELGDESQLAGLDAFSRQAGFSLSVYTRIVPAQGGLNLIIAAGPELQQALSLRGYPIKVLDPDLQGASYYLLSGASADMPHARRLTRILLVEGRQAIARVEPAELDLLAGSGFRLTLLVPRPLVVPRQNSRRIEIPTSLTPNPWVQEMIGQVSLQTLLSLVENLSGVSAVMIGNSPYTIATRYTHAETFITKATQYTFEFFQSLGLDTRYDDYSFAGGTRRNVIAEQPGLTDPGKIYLLIAHLDDTAGGNPLIFAPGADDNASGSAAVMHIASILSQYELGCTLRYALVTGEEQGLEGSAAYAEEIYIKGENLLGVLNLDMLAYNSPGSDPAVELDYHNNNDKQIANLFIEAVAAYSLQLSPFLELSYSYDSDHASFWPYNYPAILAIEDWHDHTPYYHTTGDRLNTLNLDYYTEFVKAAVATIAHLGCPPTSQLSGTVRDESSGAVIASATVEAWQSGDKIRSTTTASDGVYHLALSPGTYTILVSAADHHAVTFPTVTVNTNQTTPLDATLASCNTVKGTAFQVSTAVPAISQTVSFTATVTGGETPISYSWNFGDSGSASGATVTHAFSAKGNYPVALTTDNTCLVEQNATSYLFVGMNLIYLPTVAKK